MIKPKIKYYSVWMSSENSCFAIDIEYANVHLNPYTIIRRCHVEKGIKWWVTKINKFKEHLLSNWLLLGALGCYGAPNQQNLMKQSYKYTSTQMQWNICQMTEVTGHACSCQVFTLHTFLNDYILALDKFKLLILQ